MYQYPYGNAQQLNLDWILGKIQEIEAGSGGSSIEEVANALVSASFDAANSYRRYDYAFYNGKLYRALNDTTGAFNPSDWLEVVIGDDIPVLTRLINAVDTSLTSLQTTVGNQGNAITNLQNALGAIDSDDVDNESTVTGVTVTAALDTLKGDLNNNQLNVATVESSLIATQNYYVGDLVIVNGRLRRVTATILTGESFVSGTNIVTTEISNEMQMKEYQGTIDPDFADMGADSFYLRCYTYFHTFGIVWLSFYTPAVTPNTFITIGNFPATCTPAGTYSITWTGQKGGTYLIEFGSTGVVRMYCTDTTPQAQFIRCYIPLLVNT